MPCFVNLWTEDNKIHFAFVKLPLLTLASVKLRWLKQMNIIMQKSAALKSYRQTVKLAYCL